MFACWIKTCPLLPSTPKYNAHAQKFSIHWSYVTGMWKLLWPSFSIITKCWICWTKIGRWGLKWEDLVYPWGMWLKLNLPYPCNVFAREGDIQAFLIYSCCTRPLSTCLHLIPAFTCFWCPVWMAPVSQASGAPGKGLMRQVSVRQRECERLSVRVTSTVASSLTRQTPSDGV